MWLKSWKWKEWNFLELLKKRKTMKRKVNTRQLKSLVKWLGHLYSMPSGCLCLDLFKTQPHGIKIPEVNLNLSIKETLPFHCLGAWEKKVSNEWWMVRSFILFFLMMGKEWPRLQDWGCKRERNASGKLKRFGAFPRLAILGFDGFDIQSLCHHFSLKNNDTQGKPELHFEK